jgi:hypothetical protein
MMFSWSLGFRADRSSFVGRVEIHPNSSIRKCAFTIRKSDAGVHAKSSTAQQRFIRRAIGERQIRRSVFVLKKRANLANRRKSLRYRPVVPLFRCR